MQKVDKNGQLRALSRNSSPSAGTFDSASGLHKTEIDTERPLYAAQVRNVCGALGQAGQSRSMKYRARVENTAAEKLRCRRGLVAVFVITK